MGHLVGLLQVNDVSRHEVGQEVGVDPAGQVVAGRNGAEGARLIVEAGRVVDARRLHRAAPVALHSLDAVVEPPGRAKLEAGAVPRQRRQLPRVGRLVERKEDERGVRAVAVGVEERLRDRGQGVRGVGPENGDGLCVQ